MTIPVVPLALTFALLMFPKTSQRCLTLLGNAVALIAFGMVIVVTLGI